MITAAQVDVPGSAGEVLVWVIFGAAVVGMWMLLRRTRIKAEEARRDRLRREQEWRHRPEPEDPAA